MNWKVTSTRKVERASTVNEEALIDPKSQGRTTLVRAEGGTRVDKMLNNVGYKREGALRRHIVNMVRRHYTKSNLVPSS